METELTLRMDLMRMELLAQEPKDQDLKAL
jgi:hypothetical protein